MELNEKFWLQPVHESESVRIAALVRQAIQYSGGHQGVHVFGRKKPVAMVLVAGSRCRVSPLDDDAAGVLENKAIRAQIDAFAASGNGG